MVRNSAPAGGLVFEPFSGSGSTLAACEATGRGCNAIELDPKYVAVALERMSAMGLAPALDGQ
jgi:DNA modification methylase